MKIEIKQPKEEFNRDTYWSIVNFQSDDGEKEAKLIICASNEFLSSHFKSLNFRTAEIKTFFSEVVNDKWETKGNNIFRNPVYFDVYTETEAGKKNALNFLKDKFSWAS